jgi:hypothetical protein
MPRQKNPESEVIRDYLGKFFQQNKNQRTKKALTYKKNGA